MKNTKRVLLSVALSLISLATITCYTSCKKSSSSVDACSTVNCQNGGWCSNGSCTCPTGYTGTTCQNKATTTLTYNNNAATEVTMTLNGSNYTIPKSGSVSVTGSYDDQAIAYISAKGTNSSGGLIGEVVSFSIISRFPSSGSSTVDIDVPSEYFFLIIKNNGIESVNKCYFNYGLSTSLLYYYSVPNNGANYGFGYYNALVTYNIRLESNNYNWSFNPLTFSFTKNQYKLLTLN